MSLAGLSGLLLSIPLIWDSFKKHLKTLLKLAIGEHFIMFYYLFLFAVGGGFILCEVLCDFPFSKKVIVSMI